VIVPRKIENAVMNGIEFHIFFLTRVREKCKEGEKSLSFLLDATRVNK
jgi:hypothetical protein